MILIIIEGGVIQSISIDPVQEDDCIVVHDYDVEGCQDHPNVLPDENGDLCEWSFWNYESLETLTHSQVKFIQQMQSRIEERKKSRKPSDMSYFPTKPESLV